MNSWDKPEPGNQTVVEISSRDDHGGPKGRFSEMERKRLIQEIFGVEKRRTGKLFGCREKEKRGVKDDTQVSTLRDQVGGWWEPFVEIGNTEEKSMFKEG